MEKIKKRWEIDQNWQLLFPVLGALSCLYTGYAIARKLLHAFELNNTALEWPFTIVISIVLYFVMVRFFLWCFKKLENKWESGPKMGDDSHLHSLCHYRKLVRQVGTAISGMDWSGQGYYQ